MVAKIDLSLSVFLGGYVGYQLARYPIVPENWIPPQVASFRGEHMMHQRIWSLLWLPGLQPTMRKVANPQGQTSQRRTEPWSYSRQSELVWTVTRPQIWCIHKQEEQGLFGFMGSLDTPYDISCFSLPSKSCGMNTKLPPGSYAPLPRAGFCGEGLGLPSPIAVVHVRNCHSQGPQLGPSHWRILVSMAMSTSKFPGMV